MHPLAPTVPADVRALLKGLDVLQPPRGVAPVQRSADVMLGDALSLAETVRLGAELDQRTDDADALALPLEGAAELREEWGKAASARLLALRARIDQTYQGAFAAKGGVPDAARMLTMLRDLDALGDKPAQRTRVAAMWAGSHAQLLSALVARVRREIELFKYDLVPKLRDQAAAAQMLLRLDATLDGVIARMTVAAHQRLMAAFEARCTADFERAIAWLSPECDLPALSEWLAPRAPVGRILEQGQKLALALLDLEWCAVQGLIDAAFTAGHPREPSP